MFDYIKFNFDKSKESFTENVRDTRRDIVLEEAFNPFEEKIKILQEIDHDSELQIKNIKKILRDAKKII